MIFPTPTYVGQPAAYQGRTWFWNGTGWQVQTNAGQAVARFVSIGPIVHELNALPFISNSFYQLTYV